MRRLLVFSIIVAIEYCAALAAGAAQPERVMTAVRVEGPVTVDGMLTEPEWELAQPATDFIQRLPDTGKPATERTEVRLIYDDLNLYVGVHAFDSAGKKGITIKDIKYDFWTLDSDGFQVVIDTFDDNLNSFLFGTNPGAAKFDMQIGADGAAGNTNWNGIWYVATHINDEGWQVEMAIPFKTLRFSNKPAQIWGVNFERRVRRKHEDSYWSPLGAAFRLGRVSLAGQLEGIEGIHPGRNLYVKPYLSNTVQRLQGDDTDIKPEAGLDLKYAVGTQSTLDLTWNTDFSQVEADEQQINLTRFNLFFPEKRQFFLENAGTFGFGRSRGGFRTDLIPFFTRRIGISDDRRLVPILGGARYSGRAGKNSFGLLSMQTDDIPGVPSTNFSVLRVRRDVLSKSEIGALFVNKDENGAGFNRTFGMDANFRLFKYLEVASSLLKTQSPELQGKDMAANFEVAWWDNLLDLEVRHMNVQENFNPEVGFLQRGAMKRTSGIFMLTPRPGRRIPWVRYLGPAVNIDYITDQQGNLETRLLQAGFNMVLHNGSEFAVGRRADFERLAKPFRIRTGTEIAPGDYEFNEWYLTLKTDKSRLFYGELGLQSGEFWNGTRDGRALGLNVQPGYHFSAGALWTHNDVTLPTGPFDTDLVAARVGYLFATNLFLNTLIQYNSDLREVSTNVRFNFIYKPLSDLFLVYNERRSSSGEVLDRALIAKLTYVLAF
ncbi:MAG: hypothetical protein EHM61_20650 [Acidobacteria bacterium]|nr:MAG: hypothetical protein EHM61_20650 [Acidobacteriota bacterium]